MMDTNAKQELVGLLCACPVVKDEGSRSALLDNLPGEVRNRIAHHSRLNIHVSNILTACSNYPGGVQLLIEQVLFFDGDDARTSRDLNAFHVLHSSLAELKAILQHLAPEDDVLHQAFVAGEDEMQRFRRLECHSSPLLDCIFESLLDPLRLSTGEYPLLHFAAQLAARLGHADALPGWLKKTAGALKLPEDRLASFLQTARKNEIPQADLRHILVEVRPVGMPATSYTIQAWFTDAKGQGPKILKQSCPRNELPAQMPLVLNRLLGEPLVRETKRHCAERLYLEFFLPLDLLELELDTWTPARENPLTTDYRVVARLWERFRENLWTTPWESHWNRHCQALRQAAGSGMTWPGKPRKTRYATWLKQGQIGFGLCFCPCQDDLEDLLRVGVGILLWSRGKLPSAALRRGLKGQMLETLPEVVRDFRDNLWIKQQDTGALCLAWDDPHRLPKDQDHLLTDRNL